MGFYFIFSFFFLPVHVNFLGEIHMFLQKSMKFHSVLSFEANGLTLNYQFSSILSKLAAKFKAYMNT